MKKFYLIICLLLGAATIASAAPRSVPGRSQATLENNEDMELLDDFISATQETLKASLQLKEKLAHYQKVQEKYLADPSNREAAFRMVKEATDMMKEIEKHHLDQIFTTDFLSELSFFSHLGKKKSVSHL